jgi:hypothetical protein
MMSMKLANFVQDVAVHRGRVFAVSLIALISLMACAEIGAQTSATQSLDPIRLQAEFAAAKDLELLHTVSAIPEDIRLLFSALDGPKEPADLGMEWSSSDFIVPGLPRSQHVFSAVNGELAVVVLLFAGSNVSYRALLAPRNSRDFCLFDLGAIAPENLRLSVLQSELNPNKHSASPKAPECIRRYAH